MLDELDFGPRTSGRARKQLEVAFVRNLGESDFALLDAPRGTLPSKIKKIRDRHHALARCLAQGMKNHEAAAITGFDPAWISSLRGDPTFAELVKSYQDQESNHFADFTQRATLLSLDALNEIHDRLDESPEDFSIGQLQEVVKLTADRTGHAPVQKVQQTNINVELGGRLAAARARLQTVPSPQAEGQPAIPTSFPAENFVLEGNFELVKGSEAP